MKDFRTLQIGDKVQYTWNDEHGSWNRSGRITEATEAYAIMYSDGMDYIIDECSQDMCEIISDT